MPSNECIRVPCTRLVEYRVDRKWSHANRVLWQVAANQIFHLHLVFTIKMVAED